MNQSAFLKSARAALRGVSGVVGLGFGLKEIGGEPTPAAALRVYMKRKRARSELRRRELIPDRVYGIRTDVIEHAAAFAASGNPVVAPLDSGLRIANSKGVPGTLGCI